MTMFPLEIEFLIINECRDDPGRLAACSLVCRAWNLASRAHLFREVVLKVTSRTRRHLVDFQHILDSSLNSIGDFVEELHLIGDNDDEDAEDASPLAKSLSLEMGSVSSLVRALPRLHTLVVRNLRVVRNGLRLSPDSRPAMRRVEITCVTTTPHSRGRADDLCTLLHLFSSIHTLELNISDGQPTPRAFYPDSISEGITAGPPVKITTLLFHRLIATWIPAVCEYLNLCGQIHDDRSLKAVSIALCQRIDLWSAGLFLRLVASTVRTMRIYPGIDTTRRTFARHGDCLRVWHILDVASCVNLRSLLFCLDTNGQSRRQAAEATKSLFQGALEILGLPQLPPGLESVTFYLGHTSEGNPVTSVSDWEFMDEVLDCIVTLRSVIVQFTPGAVFPEDRFRERLARAHQKQILRFETYTMDIPWWEAPVE